MSATLDLFAPRADFNAIPVLPTAPSDFDQRFGLEWKAAHAPDRFFWHERYMAERYEKALDDLYRKTGQRLPNPALMPLTAGQGIEQLAERLTGLREQRRAMVDKVLLDARKDHPDLPDPTMFEVDAAREATQMRDRAAKAAQASVGTGGLGAFLGGMFGELSHPINLATLPLGAPRALAASAGKGFLAAFLSRETLVAGATEAGIALGSEAVIQSVDSLYRTDLGTTVPEDHVLMAMLYATGGAFVLGAGMRALGIAVRGRRMPLEGRDALRAVEAGERDLNTLLTPETLETAATAVRRGDPAPPARMPEVEPGERTAVYTSTGRRVEVEYQAVDVRTLIPSHTDDFRPNAAYRGDLQPRDRTRAASQEQVAKIERNLVPERLGPSADASTGAPIVGPDNVVESGNARTLALRRLYDQPTPRTEAYRDWLRSQGFDIDGIEQPVLVARRKTPLAEAERVSFTRESQGDTLAVSATEKAMTDAARLERILPLYERGALDSQANAKFVRNFVQSLPESERGALLRKDGTVSSEGVRRVRLALAARAYGDADLIAKLAEADGDDIKAIGNALLDTAGEWARMRQAARTGLISPEVDRTADLLAAVRVVERARALKDVPAGAGRVEYLMAQGDLLDTPDTAKAFLAMFHRDTQFRRGAGRNAIAERMRGYTDEAMNTRPGETLFGEPPVTGDEIATRLHREIADHAKALPELDKPHEAILADARRLAEEADFEVRVGGAVDAAGEIQAVTKSARALIEESDRNVGAAQAVLQCAVGAV